jgi:hypothetical protein
MENLMNFRKGFLLITAILFMYASITAQNRSLGTITGIIMDDGSKKPIEFVNVSLLNVKDNQVITGDITDAKGKFSIENIPFGDYFIKYSYEAMLKSYPLKLQLTQIILP